MIHYRCILSSYHLTPCAFMVQLLLLSSISLSLSSQLLISLSIIIAIYYSCNNFIIATHIVVLRQRIRYSIRYWIWYWIIISSIWIWRYRPCLQNTKRKSYHFVNATPHAKIYFYHRFAAICCRVSSNLNAPKLAVHTLCLFRIAISTMALRQRQNMLGFGINYSSNLFSLVNHRFSWTYFE